MPRKLYLSLQAAGQHGFWGCVFALQPCHQVKHEAMTQGCTASTLRPLHPSPAACSRIRLEAVLTSLVLQTGHVLHRLSSQIRT